MEAVPALHPRGETPPLAAARLRRQLTVEGAAKLTRLTPDEVTWLEEGKLYRFPSGDSAALALMLYATGLGISRREARSLAGLPLVARPRREQVRQIAGMLIGAVLLVSIAGAFVLPGLLHGATKPATAATAQASGLPPTWKVDVDVLNGSGDMNYTRKMADKIGSMAYRIEHVTRATRFDYTKTAVYFPPGAEGLGERLAAQLGVEALPLPGGTNTRRLVVIVGPARL
ncbi:MAG TPA: LytR C-terminal domain-containing protein [Gaiellaceae bacterium]